MRPQSLVDRFGAAGARFAGGDPELAVLTFGDVPAEYRAGREGALLLDATARGRVVVRGEERADFLHRILANDVRSLAPGAGNRNLLLDPKGKVVEMFELCVEDDAIVLEAEEGRGAALLSAVDMFLFAEKVELADASAGAAPLALCGPRAFEVVRELLGVEPPTEPGHWRESNGVRAVCAIVAGSRGWRVDAGVDGAAESFDRALAAGAAPGGLVAEDSLRVEAAAVRFGADVEGGVYPQEARLENCFSLTKGCYTGQEVVAKIDTYGGLNKRLVTVALDRDEPVARGTALLAPDDEGGTRRIGVVTSWAYSFELDRPVALAYVKRRNQAVGNAFTLDGEHGTATIVATPLRGDGEPVTGDFE
ncbi:MAG: glycine cleavage T C-terminal barrel domain-containing protein [Planctomycetota bacterium]